MEVTFSPLIDRPDRLSLFIRSYVCTLVTALTQQENEFNEMDSQFIVITFLSVRLVATASYNLAPILPLRARPHSDRHEYTAAPRPPYSCRSLLVVNALISRVETVGSVHEEIL